MANQNYNRKAYHAAKSEELRIPNELFHEMWKLFDQIKKFWYNKKDPVSDETYKTDLLAFMNNRISVDPSYLYEYKNAAEVIKELIYEHGDPEGYIQLFTDKSLIDDPPTTLIARVRQKVSNEFIVLYLSLGGFKFGGATNSLGYISGANIKGKPPYRTYNPKS